jgi:hypothetical protein
MNLRKDSEKAVGKLNYVLLEHQKVSIVILQKNRMEKQKIYMKIFQKLKN